MSIEIYSIASDFSGEVIANILIEEIIEDSGVGEDPIGIHIVGDVVTITFSSALTAPQKVALDLVITAHPASVAPVVSFSDSISEVFNFGSDNSKVKNKFLAGDVDDIASNKSAPLAKEDGQVSHISLTSSDTKSWYIDVVSGAVDGGSGTYSGGSLLGSILKPPGVKDLSADIPPGTINFSKGQRISAYLRKVSGDSKRPFVRIFVSYDSE